MGVGVGGFGFFINRFRWYYKNRGSSLWKIDVSKTDMSFLDMSKNGTSILDVPITGLKIFKIILIKNVHL